MLKKKFKLAKQKDIERVQKTGESFFTPLFVIKKYKHAEMQDSRFAVVVSNKIHKNATKRNRLRRVIFGYIEKNFSHIKPNYDVIISTSRKCFDATGKQLQRKALIETLAFGLNKSRLIN